MWYLAYPAFECLPAFGESVVDVGGAVRREGRRIHRSFVCEDDGIHVAGTGWAVIYYITQHNTHACNTSLEIMRIDDGETRQA
jgi:hypothetical protein